MEKGRGRIKFGQSFNKRLGANAANSMGEENATGVKATGSIVVTHRVALKCHFIAGTTKVGQKLERLWNVENRLEKSSQAPDAERKGKLIANQASITACGL
jgi:hypothetical protein